MHMVTDKDEQAWCVPNFFFKKKKKRWCGMFWELEN